ncbi:MAG: amino acid--tRNA ligase-related protein [Acidobacteriota bacterium]
MRPTPFFLADLASRVPLFEARDRFLARIRAFFRRRRFLEVDAPLLVPAAGMEPHLDPFVARGWETGRTAFLPTSPEFYLKKLLAAGVRRCFSLAPSFRDETPSRSHSPEFLMLEWYRAGGTLPDLIRDASALLCHLGGDLPGGKIHRSGETPVDLCGGIEVMTLGEAFERHAGGDFRRIGSVEGWRDAARARGASVGDDWTANDCFSYLMIAEVEPALRAYARPVALVGYPAFQAALASLDAADPGLSRRFELFVGGVEIANAYEELTDGAELRRRFAAYQEERRASGKDPHPEDGQFVEAVDRLGPCAGIALGADRLLALLLGETVPRIRHGAPG